MLSAFLTLALVAVACQETAAPKHSSSAAEARRESLIVGTVVLVRFDSAQITVREVDVMGKHKPRFVTYRTSQRSLNLDLRPGDRIMGALVGKDHVLQIVKHSRAAQVNASK